MSRPPIHRHAAAGLTALLAIPLSVALSSTPAQAATTCARAAASHDTFYESPWQIDSTVVATRTYDGRRVSVLRGWAHAAGGGGATQEVAFGALVSAGSPVGNADGVKLEITTDGGSTHIDCTESMTRGGEKYTWFYIPQPNNSNYLFRACYYYVQTGNNRACTGWW